jgi:hypothetical protein
MQLSMISDPMILGKFNLTKISAACQILCIHLKQLKEYYGPTW